MLGLYVNECGISVDRETRNVNKFNSILCTLCKQEDIDNLSSLLEQNKMSENTFIQYMTNVLPVSRVSDVGNVIKTWIKMVNPCFTDNEVKEFIIKIKRIANA